MIDGVYTPDIQVVPIDGAAVAVYSAYDVDVHIGTHNGPVCLVLADLSGVVASTMAIEKGTWDDGTAIFTPNTVDPRIGYLMAPAALTVSKGIIYVLAKPDTAIRVTTTGGAATKAHLRIQGRVIKVA